MNDDIVISQGPHKEGEPVPVNISGRVNIENSKQIAKFFDSLFAQNYFRIDVDLTETVTVSSAGWREFTFAQKKCKENNGEIQLVLSNKSRTAEVFEMTGLEEFFVVTFVSASMGIAGAENEEAG